MRLTRTRLVFAAFAIIGMAVGINALFLQTGRHPAPLIIGAPNKTASVKQAPSRLDPLGALIGSHAVVGKSVQSKPGNLVRTIQLKLTEKGYDPGPADGLNGRMTQAAIMAFQTDNQRPATGRPGDDLLRLLRGEQPPAPVSGRVAESTLALIKDIQKNLAASGYQPGEADGIAGAATRNAIQSFERDNGLPITGRISGRFWRKLQEKRVIVDRLS